MHGAFCKKRTCDKYFTKLKLGHLREKVKRNEKMPRAGYRSKREHWPCGTYVSIDPALPANVLSQQNFRKVPEVNPNLVADLKKEGVWRKFQIKYLKTTETFQT